MSTAMPVGITDAQLAVLLRQAQWALDDAAHDVPAGRATSRQRAELAGTLEALALLLRTPAPQLPVIGRTQPGSAHPPSVEGGAPHGARGR